MSIVPAFIRRRIAHRPNLVKIIDNIGWLFFDKLLRMGMGLLVGVWVARYLGPEQYGLLNFALAFTGLFGAIATLGLQGIVVRDIVRNPESACLTLGTAAILQLVGGLLSFLLILASIAYLRPDDALARTIVTILGAMMLLKGSEIAVYWFESQVQSKYTVWVQNGVFVIFAGIKIALIKYQVSLIVFVWVMLAEAALVALILMMVMNHCGIALASLNSNMGYIKKLLKDSWPLFISLITINLYMKIDQIMLGQMVNDEAVGLYAAATRISEVWYFLPMVIVSSVFPSIIEAKNRSEVKYRLQMQKLYDSLALICITITLPVALFSDTLVALLFGERYIEASNVLVIHIWALFFVSLGVSSGKSMIVDNMQLLALKRNLYGALLNITLNLLLIPHYQIEGAAIASLVAYAFAYYFSDLFDKRTRHMFMQKTKSLINLLENLRNILKKRCEPEK